MLGLVIYSSWGVLGPLGGWAMVPFEVQTRLGDTMICDHGRHSDYCTSSTDPRHLANQWEYNSSFCTLLKVDEYCRRAFAVSMKTGSDTPYRGRNVTGRVG